MTALITKDCMDNNNNNNNNKYERCWECGKRHTIFDIIKMGKLEDKTAATLCHNCYENKRIWYINKIRRGEE